MLTLFQSVGLYYTTGLHRAGLFRPFGGRWFFLAVRRERQTHFLPDFFGDIGLAHDRVVKHHLHGTLLIVDFGVLHAGQGHDDPPHCPGYGWTADARRTKIHGPNHLLVLRLMGKFIVTIVPFRSWLSSVTLPLWASMTFLTT